MLKQNFLLGLCVAAAIVVMMNVGEKKEPLEPKQIVNKQANENSVELVAQNKSIEATSPKQPMQSAWISSSGIDHMNDSMIAIASTKSTQPIKAWLKSPTPTLTIRCANNKTEAYIDIGTRVQPELGNYDQATITVRFDEEKSFNLLTTESTDGEALFIPKAISFAKRAEKAKLILIQFTPFNSDPAIAWFRGGKDDAESIKTVRKACNW